MMAKGTNMDKLLKMNLHETLMPDTQHAVSILRVPGGWVYTTFYEGAISSMFVPFAIDKWLL